MASFLYRRLLRLGRAFDATPRLKPLLLLPKTSFVAPQSPLLPHVQALRSAFAGEGNAGYRPATSLSAFIRSQFPVIARTGEGSGAAAAAATATLLPATLSLNDKFALGQLATKVLEVIQKDDMDQARVPDNHVPIINVTTAGGGGGGSSTTPAGISSEVQVVTTLTPGSLLVEHTEAMAPGRALIAIYDISKNVQEVHGDEQWFARGYIVNRPYPADVGTVMQRKDLGAFGRLTLFHGGMDKPGLSILHSCPDIESCSPVDEAETLFIGGSIEDINKRLEDGRAKPSDFKVFYGQTWFPLQVVNSKEGAAAASSGSGSSSSKDEVAFPDGERFTYLQGPGARTLALLPALFDTQGRYRDGKGLGLHEQVEGYNYSRYWHQNIAWSTAMRWAAEGLQREGQLEMAREYAGLAELHVAVQHYVAAGLHPLPASPEATQQETVA